MRTRDCLDRAALVLGVVSIVSAVFVFVHGTFELVQIGAAGPVVALVLGLLAVVAGWLDERTLMLAAGAGFLIAAAVQLVLGRAAAAAFSAATHRRFRYGWVWVSGWSWSVLPPYLRRLKRAGKQLTELCTRGRQIALRPAGKGFEPTPSAARVGSNVGFPTTNEIRTS